MTMNCPQIIHELIIDEKFVGNSWTFRGQFMDFRVRVRACSQIASVVKYVFLSKKKKYVLYVFLSKKEEYVLYVFLSKKENLSLCYSVFFVCSSVLTSDNKPRLRIYSFERRPMPGRISPKAEQIYKLLIISLLCYFCLFST